MSGAIVALKYKIFASNSLLFCFGLFRLYIVREERDSTMPSHVSRSFRVLMALFFFKISSFNNGNFVRKFTVSVKLRSNRFVSFTSGGFRPLFHFCLLSKSLISVKEESTTNPLVAMKSF